MNNREILFRGQTRKRGEKVRMDGSPVESNWVYGGIFHPNNSGGDFSIIYSYDPIEKRTVYADTVGQYTGLTDKNGTKIFEGDILSTGNTDEYLGVVEWDSDNTGLAVLFDGMFESFRELLFIDEVKVEVIGNIYDNPELLKGE